MVVPSAVFAADPTTLTVNWGGSGVVTGSGVVGNDAAYNFATSGSAVGGNFNVVASNDNPYGYNVGTSSSYIDADVANGSIFYEANRTDSYSGMYGLAGQTAASFVGTDGVGEMATGAWNNYASMVNGTYGKPHTSGGYNYQAVGTNYLIASYIGIGDAAINGNGSPVFSSTGNYAVLSSVGNGSSKINDMTNQMYGNSLAFGQGGGCYTNANGVMTGSGQFAVQGYGTNGIQSALGSYALSGAGSNLNIVATGNTVNYGSGITTTGSGLGSTTLSVIANYGSGATVSDYSLTVK